MNSEPVSFEDLEKSYQLRNQIYQVWGSPSAIQQPKKDNFWLIIGIICLSITTFILGILWTKFQSKDQKENDIKENDNVNKEENAIEKQFVD